MRGFRYFMQYYPGGAYVTEYWLYDKAGKRVGRNLRRRRIGPLGLRDPAGHLRPTLGGVTEGARS